MRRFFFTAASFFLLSVFSFSAYSQSEEFIEEKTFEPKKKKQEYQHLLVLGANQPFSGGSNSFSPVWAYLWFGENFSNPDLYMEFGFTTTRLWFITAMKTDRIYWGVKPLVEHTTYAGWKTYNKGYDDKSRDINGSDLGLEGFFQYNFLRILYMRAAFLPTYHLYIIPLLTPNEHKHIQTPRNHFQVKPSIKITLNTVQTKSLDRIKHGVFLEVEYQYARRIGYGSWYDYDRMIFWEKSNGYWYPGLYSNASPYSGNQMFSSSWQGIWYKSNIKDTHRLYFTTGGYYNFKHDINLQFDFTGGYFKGIDRNNAEQIGYFLADYAVMPGYFCAEFYSQFYMIARLQIGIPIPFWNTRIQPGYNVLYMPGKNEVVGVGKGAISNPWYVRGYPRKFYTSVSVTLSTQLGNYLPMFISYAYGIDAQRGKSANDVYYSKIHLAKISRGNHEVQILFIGAFVKNEVK